MSEILKVADIIQVLKTLFGRKVLNITRPWKSSWKMWAELNAKPEFHIKGNEITFLYTINPCKLIIYDSPLMLKLIKHNIGYRKYFYPFEWGELAMDIFLFDWKNPENADRIEVKTGSEINNNNDNNNNNKPKQGSLF